MIKRILLAFFIIMFFQSGIFSDPAFIDEVIKNMDTMKMEQYAYTLTTVQKGKKTVELYEPLLEGDFKWQLILIEDKLPVLKDHNEYKAKKLKALKEEQDEEMVKTTKKNKQQMWPMAIDDILQKESLVLIEDTGQIMLYSFKMAEMDNQFGKIMQKLECFLRINKPGKYVELISMQSPASFSPFLGVEIKKFRMEMIFAPIDNKNAVLPREAQFTFQGSAFLIHQFDEDVTTTYSNYQYRGNHSQ